MSSGAPEVPFAVAMMALHDRLDELFHAHQRARLDRDFARGPSRCDEPVSGSQRVPARGRAGGLERAAVPPGPR